MDGHLKKLLHYIDTLTCVGFVSVIILATPQSAFANDTQTLESIHAAVILFVRGSFDKSTKVEIKVGLNDNRLRLQRCAEPLDVFWNSATRKIGNTSVGVRCTGAIRWTIYAPVKIKVFKAVMIAANTLARGQQFQASNYHMEERDIGRLVGGYITSPAQYHGYSVKRPVNVGRVITPAMLQIPKMVRRGERVTLLAEAGGLQVRSSGVALEGGLQGDTVRIRNSSSQRVIEGRILSPGVVKIAL